MPIIVDSKFHGLVSDLFGFKTHLFTVSTLAAVSVFSPLA